MVVLGLSNMRDAAAAIVRDGSIVAAAEEERFVRVKHVSGLPVQAIRYCLREAGLRLAEVDHIAVPWRHWVVGRRGRLALGAMSRSPTFFRVKGRRSLERIAAEWAELAFLGSRLRRAFGDGAPRPVHLDHHLCHAASAFLVSPFERAAILVVDGASEAHTAMLALGEGNQIRVLQRTPLPHSLGQFYAGFTSYLGFRPDQDEYIVMGLAAYGEPRFAPLLRQHVLRPGTGGTFTLNTRLLDFHLARLGLFLPEFVGLFGPPRLAGEEVTQRHRDLAASAQVVLEETLLHLARHLEHLTGADRLCLAGGVAFNCVANSRLRRELDFREVYVQPAAGDAGTALGAALWLAARKDRAATRQVLGQAYLGPQFTEADCRRAVEQAGLVWEVHEEDELCDRVAAELARGKLVFWFQGRMEWGPRALGNRSLLADPRREDMRELINAKVKLREPFRPFAPAVIEERAADYFEAPRPSPFMQFTFSVRPSAKGLIPAVVHVDGTSRIQTVDRDSNPRFRKLLEAFERTTAIPVLLNTSFNVNEPIVCTPEDAVACFRRTDVEWLVLGRLLVWRGRPARGHA
jgi:carbamoyltransferase